MNDYDRVRRDLLENNMEVLCNILGEVILLLNEKKIITDDEVDLLAKKECLYAADAMSDYTDGGEKEDDNNQTDRNGGDDFGYGPS